MKNNYRVLNTCMNCQHCLSWGGVDFYTLVHYCNLDKTWKEFYFNFGLNSQEFFESAEWLEKHTIWDNAICDDYLQELRD